MEQSTITTTNTAHMNRDTTAFGALFDIGDMGATPGAVAAFEEAYGDKSRPAMLALTLRHVTGDFGDLSENDRTANIEAIEQGERILSCYLLRELPGQACGEPVWIITEADRASTVILLPHEY
jgi:hypothetical protein